jgi:hypothetical protein
MVILMQVGAITRRSGRSSLSPAVWRTCRLKKSSEAVAALYRFSDGRHCHQFLCPSVGNFLADLVDLRR